jgi:hypothetical protein
MKRLTLLLAVALLGGGSAALVLASPLPPTRENPPGSLKENWEAFLTNAVFEGLKADGVPREVAQRLGADENNFFGKCPLCECVRVALQRYTELRQQPAGPGLKGDLQQRLLDPKAEVRRPALRELVGGYVERRYKDLRVNAQDRAALQKEFEQRAMKPKNADEAHAFCPSCDGACCRMPPR